MGKRWLRTWMMDHAYAVTIGCTLAIVVGCAVYTQALREEQAAGIEAAAKAPEIQETPQQTPELTPLPTIAPLAVRPLWTGVGDWPMDGQILRAYDEQESLWWEAMSLWQTHAGLDIVGAAGESVRACMDGVVADVRCDVLWGVQVTIEHEGDRETRYAGLESSLVEPGAKVRRGQAIGTLLESIPCEAELPAHLHFEMIRDGKHQDPEATLADR